MIFMKGEKKKKCLITLTFAISHCIAYLVQLYGSHYILQNQKRKQKRIKIKKIGFILGVNYIFSN